MPKKVWAVVLSQGLIPTDVWFFRTLSDAGRQADFLEREGKEEKRDGSDWEVRVIEAIAGPGVE